MASELGLRERKKQRTRLHIADTARRLFLERGFEEVPVAEVARQAEVSVATVFNYFPTKEDLFYSGMETFEQQLVDAVRERPAGEAVLATFRRRVLDGVPRLATREAAELIQTAARIIGESRSLQAREREIVAGYTQQLAVLLADETGRPPGDVESAAVAAALMGAQRALVTHVHQQVVAGRRGARLAADASSHAERAFDRLEHGLRDYAIKPDTHEPASTPGPTKQAGH